MKTISIVIPVFNEEQYILNTLEKIITSDTQGLTKEIVVIDDASTDGTTQKLKGFERSFIRKKNPKIIIIYKKINEGKGAALKDGFKVTTGDIVLVQDADLEYSPDDYPTVLEPLIKGDADVVYGSRFISNRPHRVLYFWHYVINIMLTGFSNMLTNLNLTDMETGCKVFKGKVIRGIADRLSAKRFGFEPEITARIAKNRRLKIYEVGISYSGRTYEEGKKIGWIDGVKAIGEIIRYNIFER